MKPTSKTTVGAAVLGGAVSTIALFVENKLGAGITAEVAGAQTTIIVALFTAYLPLKLRR